jgi:hypothetical protein
MDGAARRFFQQCTEAAALDRAPRAPVRGAALPAAARLDSPAARKQLERCLRSRAASATEEFGTRGREAGRAAQN